MAFGSVGNTGGSGDGSSDVDYNAMNQHILDVWGKKEKRSLVGIISTIAELGTQELEDGHMKFTGTPEEKQAIIDKDDGQYFALVNKDGDIVESGGELHKFWKQKPVNCVAFTVDFPQVMVDKGQFFGESNPAPLRMVLNGEWRFLKTDGSGQKELRLNRNYELKQSTQEFGSWSLKSASIPYKLAASAGVCESSGGFSRYDVDKLLGTAHQFEVKLSPYTSGGKTYLNERISFKGEPAEGVPIPELDDSLKGIIQINAENDADQVKNLRASIKNTMRMSSDYEGSILAKQIEASRGTTAPEGGDQGENKAPMAEPEKKPEAKPLAAADLDLDDVDFDDDIPF